MPETVPFELAVRYQIYQYFARHGQAPSYQDIAADLAAPEEAVRQAFHALHKRHLLFLQAGSDAIQMASPFSGVPTRYRVAAGGVEWWANCAWDSVGIAAALGADVHIRAEYPDGSGSAEFDVRGGKIDGRGHVVYFALGFKHWYDDLVYT
jgi:hypothetical protein